MSIYLVYESAVFSVISVYIGVYKLSKSYINTELV